MTLDRKCSRFGCTRAPYGRDLCRVHYRKAWEEGTLPTTWNKRTGPAYWAPQEPRADGWVCSLDDCDRPWHDSGLCSNHALIARRDGWLPKVYDTPPPPPRGKYAHGVLKCYAAGCRCDVCQDAFDRCTDPTRVDRMRRMMADPTVAPHGEVKTYVGWGCDCDPCTAAHAKMQADARARNKARRAARAAVAADQSRAITPRSRQHR